jgi:hypothetical protein
VGQPYPPSPYQPPYQPPFQPPPPRRDHSTRNLLVGLGALLIVAVAVVLIVILTRKHNAAKATTVRTEPISTINADPFAPAPAGTDKKIQPVRTSAPVTVPGGHVGLYGGTLNHSTCDKHQLVTFLQDNPDKAAAWASVLGISTTEIPSYVDGLTPVLLRSDTLVTNHGYANGQATAIPAVLEAGTAVLVDDRGFPVTKCYCGNPLTPPTYYTPTYKPTYTGPSWTGFSGQSITIIENNTTIINTFTLVDPVTRQSFNRPAGTDGKADTPTTPTPSPTPTPLPTQPPPPPPTQPPPSPTPPVPAGPTVEQQAIDKLNAGAQQCFPFPAPIEQGFGQNTITTAPQDANSFVLTVVTHNQDGSTLQTFTWSVDRSTLAFTPTNDLAQVASNHCAALR